MNHCAEMERIIAGEQVFWKDGGMETEILNSTPEYSVFFLNAVSDDADFSSEIRSAWLFVNTLSKDSKRDVSPEG